MRCSTFTAVCGLFLAVIVVPGPHSPQADEKQPEPLAVGMKAGQEWSGNGLKSKLCWCPPGKFTMGGPKDEPGRQKDEDQVPVTLTKGFWLGKYEVTQSEWQRVMGTTVAEQRDKADKEKTLYGEGDGYPMYYVSYSDAAEFCEKLTQQERAAARLPAGWAYRLPTEAQWEYASRAGTTTATAFGNRLSSKEANFDGNFPYNGAAKGVYKQATMRVGSYAPNAWGLCDMNGNVFEWCRDWYFKKLPGGSDPEVSLEPVGSTFTGRVYRGGSWYGDGGFCRSAYRNVNFPVYRDKVLGFRMSAVQSSQ